MRQIPYQSVKVFTRRDPRPWREVVAQRARREHGSVKAIQRAYNLSEGYARGILYATATLPALEALTASGGPLYEFDLFLARWRLTGPKFAALLDQHFEAKARALALEHANVLPITKCFRSRGRS